MRQAILNREKNNDPEFDMENNVIFVFLTPPIPDESDAPKMTKDMPIMRDRGKKKQMEDMVIRKYSYNKVYAFYSDGQAVAEHKAAFIRLVHDFGLWDEIRQWLQYPGLKFEEAAEKFLRREKYTHEIGSKVMSLLKWHPAKVESKA